MPRKRAPRIPSTPAGQLAGLQVPSPARNIGIPQAPPARARRPARRQPRASKPAQQRSKPPLVRAPWGLTPSLAPDVKAYLRCLADPFDAPAAPIPYGPSQASSVYKNYGKFFVTCANASDIAWAVCTPYFANDEYAGVYSTNTWTGDSIPVPSGGSPGQAAVTLVGSPYNFEAFQAGSGSGSGLHARCISAAMRVTCINPQVAVGGYGIMGMTPFSSPGPMTGQTGLTPASVRLAGQGYSKDLVLTAPNTYVWSPLNMEDLDYPDEGFWSPPSTLMNVWNSAAQGFGYEQTFPMFFCAQSATGQPLNFMVEFVTNFQVSGVDFRTLATPPSTIGPSRHVAALANVGAITRSAIVDSPHAAAIAHKPSFFKRMVDGVKRFGHDLLHDGAQIAGSAVGTILGNGARRALTRGVDDVYHDTFGRLPSTTTVEEVADDGALLLM